MPPSEAGSASSECNQQTFVKEVNSSSLNGRKMTASEPKKVITKSKSKSSLEEKQNGSKKTISKSRTLSTLKEVNNPIINAKSDTVTKSSKNSTKEEHSTSDKKQKKSLAKSKTNKDLKISENSMNNLPVKSLVKSKTLVKYDNMDNSTSVDKNSEISQTSDLSIETEPRIQKSMTKSKTVAKLKSVNNIGDDEPHKPIRKSKSIAQIVEVNEPVSEILDHKKANPPAHPPEEFEAICDKNLVRARGKTKLLTCITEEPNVTESNNSQMKMEELDTNALKNLNLVPRSLAKSRTVTKLKSAKDVNDEGSKSMRKCRSQSQLKASSAVDPNVSDEPDSSLLFNILTKEKCVEDAVAPTSSDLEYVTPKSLSTVYKDRMKKLAFSDVSIFYFDRTQGYCSIPRDGGNTIGMDMRHSHQEKRRLCEEQEPTVKRKLFNFERSSSIELNDLKEEAESISTNDSIFVENPNNDQFENKLATQKSSFFKVDDDDIEISFKTSVKKETEPTDLDDTKSPLESNANTDPTVGIEIGLFQKACLSSPERVQLDFVPEKSSLDHSPSFKRSLSLSISEDDLAFPWRPLRERKNSVSFVPPRKTQKPSQHPRTMSSSVSSFNLQPHLAYRSSPRLSNIKSTSSLLSETLTTPKTGKICKKNESLRKSAFRQNQSSGLSKAFSKVDLKLSEVMDEKSTGGLPKPGEDLVQSITKNCLRSFRKFSVSPESKTHKVADIKPDIDEKPKEMVIDNVPETPQSNTAPVGRGSNSSSKRSKKKGECGTRGLTPLNSKARFSLLKSYGILNIDKVEAEEIRNIRESREQCGCSCRGDCKPESCECARNGIECQVERIGFPCKCGVGCKNPNGRKVFDEMEVSLHFINTMMNMKGVLDISGSEESLCQNRQLVDKR